MKKKLFILYILFFLLVGFGLIILFRAKKPVIFFSEENILLTATVTPPSASFQYKLPFNEYTVILERSASGNIERSFWNLPLKNVEIKVNPSSPHDTLPMGYFYFVKDQNTFYELQSGGFSTLTLITEEDLKSRIKNVEQKFKKVTCEMNDYSLEVTVKAIKCTTTNINPDNPDQIDQSSINNCYFPLKKDLFLAYEQRVKPMGDLDLCKHLSEMGVQRARIE